MSSTTRDPNNVYLNETIPHESPGPNRHGSHDVNPPADRSGQRYTFSSGARPLDGFTIKRAIGRGGFGEVYYAHSDAGKEVALKLITRNLEIERRGVVQCMNLKSPHLVAIHDLKQNEHGDTFVIMEYIAGPSLAQILAQAPAGLPTAEIRMWLKGLVDGVAYLHDHGIVHRDLKPANLFLEEGVVKIGDYGLTKAVSAASQNPGHSECVGTCHYMAPETSTGKYHKPIDVYAIGVILFEMVTGRVPFDGESVGEVLMKHLTSRPDLSVLPEPFKGIVGRALAKDPNHRPQRVTDLLLPGDAPKEAAVRFIGDKSWPPNGPAPIGANAPKEDVLRITDEEPVFYIGPDTRPSRPVNKSCNVRNWLWTQSPVARVVKARRATVRTSIAPGPAPRPAPVPAAARPPAPPRPPAPKAQPVVLGPPPPLPSTRIRVGELAGSMLWAAPLAALGSVLAVPLTAAAADAPSTDPRQMALAFSLTMLGTWGAAIVGKMWEGRTSGGLLRQRGMMLVMGAIVGLAGLGLAEATHIGPSAAVGVRTFEPSLFSFATPSIRATLAGAADYATYFGLAFAVAPAWKLAVRDRRRKFRFLPIAWAGLSSAALGLAFPSLLPVGPLTLALTAVVTQFVSPWSRDAAEYVRLSRRKAVA